MGTFLNEINTNNFTGFTFASLIGSYAIKIIFYIFASVGIYTLAKKNNYENKWISFVPFLQYYMLGKLAGKITIFGANVKSAGLITAIITFCNFVYNTVFNILTYFGPIKEYLSGNSVEIVVSQGLYIMSVLSIFIAIAEVFFLVSLFFAFFRKYKPRYAFMFTIFSIFFDIGGLFIFICRNKEPVEYNQNQYNRNPYGNPYSQNPYNNPYGQNPYNPYSQNPYGAPPKQDEPFSEFGNNETVSDPFAEFEVKPNPVSGGSGNAQSTQSKENGVSEDNQNDSKDNKE